MSDTHTIFLLLNTFRQNLMILNKKHFYIMHRIFKTVYLLQLDGKYLTKTLLIQKTQAFIDIVFIEERKCCTYSSISSLFTFALQKSRDGLNSV